MISGIKNMENKYSKGKHCEKCGRRITNNEAWFSLTKWGFELCYDDQSPYRLRSFKENVLNSKYI